MPMKITSLSSCCNLIIGFVIFELRNMQAFENWISSSITNSEFGYNIMAVCGCMSTVHRNWQGNIMGTRDIGPTAGFGYRNTSSQKISLAFGGSVSMGLRLRLPCTRSVKSSLRKNGLPLQVSMLRWVLFNPFFIEWSNSVNNNGWLATQVVCLDYPRPELENTVNFLEAAYLSSTFRASSRPTKPLEVIIAGAGNERLCQLKVMFVPV